MTQKMIIKYLKFLQKECIRHQNDEIISDDEINQLNIEVTRFIYEVNKNSTPELKIEIAKIDFNLNEKNHNHPKYKWLGFIGGSNGKHFKEQENRKQRFLKLYNDLDTSLFRIKLI